MQGNAPVEQKVAAAAGGSTAVGLVTWILVTYIPAFSSGLPASLAALLPALLGTIGGFVSAYMARHTPRTDEVMKAVVGAQYQAGITAVETGTAGSAYKQVAGTEAVIEPPAVAPPVQAPSVPAPVYHASTEGLPVVSASQLIKDPYDR